jgi:hypothetical protein
MFRVNLAVQCPLKVLNAKGRLLIIPANIRLALNSTRVKDSSLIGGSISDEGNVIIIASQYYETFSP